jgi:hypothetical protein
MGGRVADRRVVRIRNDRWAAALQTAGWYCHAPTHHFTLPARAPPPTAAGGRYGPLPKGERLPPRRGTQRLAEQTAAAPEAAAFNVARRSEASVESPGWARPAPLSLGVVAGDPASGTTAAIEVMTGLENPTSMRLLTRSEFRLAILVVAVSCGMVMVTLMARREARSRRPVLANEISTAVTNTEATLATVRLNLSCLSASNSRRVMFNVRDIRTTETLLVVVVPAGNPACNALFVEVAPPLNGFKRP